MLHGIQVLNSVIIGLDASPIVSYVATAQTIG